MEFLKAPSSTNPALGGLIDGRVREVGISRTLQEETPVGADFIMHLDVCSPDMFPSAYQLLTSVAVCPISSVSVERLFSTLKRINAQNRRSMGTVRLRQLCVLSVEADLTRKIRTTPKLVVSALKPSLLCLGGLGRSLPVDITEN